MLVYQAAKLLGYQAEWLPNQAGCKVPKSKCFFFQGVLGKLPSYQADQVTLAVRETKQLNPMRFRPEAELLNKLGGFTLYC